MTAPKMTRKEALEEAKRRWVVGDAAHVAWVRWYRKAQAIPGWRKAVKSFQVGYDHISHGRQRMGEGESWEAAFADADRRATK